MNTRITLKNIKHAEFASEETHCYSASVYFDGKRVGEVKNDGHGGADYEYITNADGWKAMQEHIATLPEVVTDMYDPHDKSKAFTYPNTLEGICSDLVTDWLIDKDLKKVTRGKVAFYVGDFDGSYRFYPTTKFSEEKIRTHIAKAVPDAVILNDLPKEELRALFA